MITDGFKELIFHDRNNDQYLLDGLTNRRVMILLICLLYGSYNLLYDSRANILT